LVAHQPTLGVAIPCYRPHAHLISDCLDTLEAQTVKPTKVVISCSSTTERPSISHPYSFPYEILVTSEPQTAAQNRNVAARHLDTDLLSFFDVDDQMHPRRLETILRCFESPCDLVLHSFVESVDAFRDDIKIRRNVLQRAPSGCAVVHDDIPAKIHHAHSTVRREIYERIQFREQPEYNHHEDSLFCGDVLTLPNLRTAYCTAPLSAYVPSGVNP
jgi:glycosyltransferase involved in cell wall biosynthesis